MHVCNYTVLLAVAINLYTVHAVYMYIHTLGANVKHAWRYIACTLHGQRFTSYVCHELIVACIGTCMQYL